MNSLLSLLSFVFISNFALAQIQSPPPPAPPSPASVDYESVFQAAEKMPVFPACKDLECSHGTNVKCVGDNLRTFIYKHIKYPESAKAAGLEGYCFLTFIVEKDGSISNIELLRDIGGGCGREAVRVINLMNEKGMIWTPGNHHGKTVKCKLNVPIQFKL